MDMNGVVSKQSIAASQGANIIKIQTSGKGGGGEEGQQSRSSLHLSLLKINEGRKRRMESEIKPDDFWMTIIAFLIILSILCVTVLSGTCWCCVNIFLGVLRVLRMSIIDSMLCATL